MPNMNLAPRTRLSWTLQIRQQAPELFLAITDRSTYTDLAFRRHHKTLGPTLHIFSDKALSDAVCQSLSSRGSKTGEKYASMGSGLELPNIGKIKVLSDEKAVLTLSKIPYSGIGLTFQSFFHHRITVITLPCQIISQACRQIFVRFDLHRLPGTPGAGRSSWAE